ncbi:hypothetical protein [Pseudomonas chlororaphis]|uniref:hypothetical protein n=1 Tax=Pseudomonas chlororaphis TaxID=587753 RepID=UPI002D7963A2|nr:hypothetical protein [Pseudomonas chlororaphis]
MLKGELIEHGPAPYQNNPKNESSYFVTLKTASGDRTVWGKGLEKAMMKQSLAQGERIRLQDHGTVAVTIRTRGANGTIVTKEGYRREWSAERETAAMDQNAPTPAQSTHNGQPATLDLSQPQQPATAPVEESSFIVESHTNMLARLGGIDIGLLMAEPTLARQHADFQAAQVVVGNDTTEAGKALVSGLMQYENYRLAFKESATTYYEETPDGLKAEMEAGFSVAKDLVAAAEALYGAAQPTQAEPTRSAAELTALHEQYGARVEIVDLVTPENLHGENPVVEVFDSKLGSLGIFQGTYEAAFDHAVMAIEQREKNAPLERTSEVDGPVTIIHNGSPVTVDPSNADDVAKYTRQLTTEVTEQRSRIEHTTVRIGELVNLRDNHSADRGPEFIEQCNKEIAEGERQIESRKGILEQAEAGLKALAPSAAAAVVTSTVSQAKPSVAVSAMEQQGEPEHPLTLTQIQERLTLVSHVMESVHPGRQVWEALIDGEPVGTYENVSREEAWGAAIQDAVKVEEQWALKLGKPSAAPINIIHNGSPVTVDPHNADDVAKYTRQLTTEVTEQRSRIEHTTVRIGELVNLRDNHSADRGPEFIEQCNKEIAEGERQIESRKGILEQAEAGLKALAPSAAAAVVTSTVSQAEPSVVESAPVISEPEEDHGPEMA